MLLIQTCDMKETINSEQLLSLININKPKIIEAALLLNYNGKAIHFFSIKKSLLFDEGIDGELTKWKINEFISQYENSQWLIEQIV